MSVQDESCFIVEILCRFANATLLPVSLQDVIVNPAEKQNWTKPDLVWDGLPVWSGWKSNFNQLTTG